MKSPHKNIIDIHRENLLESQQQVSMARCHGITKSVMTIR